MKCWSSTMKPTFATWSPACSRTKAMRCAPRPTARARSTRSRTGGRAWSCSTSGCRARGSTGCRLLEQVKRRDPTLPVLMISGHGNLDTAVAAIREGAVDFIEKPFEAEQAAPPRRPRDRDRPAAARECRLPPASRAGRPARRLVGRDQHRPRDAEAGRADRQPGADHRPGRGRQGNRRADDPQLEPARRRRRSSSSRRR